MEIPPERVPLYAEVSRNPRNSLRLVVSCNFILLLTFKLVFVQCQGTTATEQRHHENMSSLEMEQKTNIPSCKDPKYKNGSLITHCSGFTTIPTVNVPRQHELAQLDMFSENKFDILTDGQLERANLPKLINLILDHCQITDLQLGAFRGGIGLKHLSLKNNLIQILNPQVFDGLVNLEELHLDNNPIKTFQVGTAFPLMPSLTYLDLSSCELSFIPENTFDKLRKLKSLHLDNNKLTTLSWKVFRNLETFEGILLGHNPWQCDCHVRFLIEILGESYKEFFGCTTSKFDKSYMNCPPKVEEFDFGNQSSAKIELGYDVLFECTYSGYPPPTVTWLKDGTPIEIGTAEIKNVTHDLLKNLDGEEMKRNIKFKEVLILRQVKAIDSGNYTCFVKNDAGQFEKAKFFKLNDKSVVLGMTTGLWVLVAVFLILLLILLPLSIFLVRRQWKNRRQRILKNNVSLQNAILGLRELRHVQEVIALQQAETRMDENQCNENVPTPLLS